jgi:hypothetical protein
MPKIPMDRIQDYYRAHRRENFAASQRLEGIETPATAKDAKSPLPSKEQLREKYAARRS